MRSLTMIGRLLDISVSRDFQPTTVMTTAIAQRKNPHVIRHN